MKITKYLRLPILAVVAILFIYGSIGLAKSQNQTENTQNNLQEKIEGLQKQIIQNQNQNDNQIAELQKQIKAPTPPKQVAGASITKEIQYVEKTVTQTVTKEVEKNQAVVTIENLGSYRVDLQSNDNAFTILKRASEQNGFPIEYQEYSFGVFITSIGGIKPSGNQYWAFYYNGKYSIVGASSQPISKNDTTFWKLESF
jgi:TolA-binding protein